MPDLHQVIESELQKLTKTFEGAEVKRVHRPAPKLARNRHPHGRAQSEELIPLLGFEGRSKQRKFHLDFIPWQNETYLMSLYMSAASPVKLALALKQGQLQPFPANTGSSRVSIEERFDVETNREELASQLLADPAVEAIIDRLGPFHRLALDARFLKLSRHIEVAKDVAAQRITSDVEVLEALAQMLEERGASPDPPRGS